MGGGWVWHEDIKDVVEEIEDSLRDLGGVRDGLTKLKTKTATDAVKSLDEIGTNLVEQAKFLKERAKEADDGDFSVPDTWIPTIRRVYERVRYGAVPDGQDAEDILSLLDALADLFSFCGASLRCREP